MDYLEMLNPEQKDAVLHTEGPATDFSWGRIWKNKSFDT